MALAFFILVMGIIFFHFVSDFVLQSDEMAVNKSTSWYWLTVHVITYTSVMTALMSPVFGFTYTLMIWAEITFATHFVTDAVTSRISSYFWKRNERHWFFVTIGFDQVIHYACLFATFLFCLQNLYID